MAATRKSAKRTAGKKGKSAKGSSAKKRPARKAAAKGRVRGGAPKAALKRTARKGLRAAQEGIDTVRQAGEKTWEVLKSTTTQVVEGVRDRFGDESNQAPTHR